ncbi:ComEC/Rec2 family competence protein [Cupriavidus sp. TMH.W2]|uniref:ComEC/Rec2 family competence protein n=1 Tax=Cupriavidus sp. TMH.W2 TaxID=3434465 RepID=UPI003D780B47
MEIDFLPVGKGESSGDAIAIRWKESDRYKVMIYDGGTKDYGEALVNHVKGHYGTTHVDYVVNSHPDNDHAGGLLYVLENMTVGELWMHRPWQYSAQIRDYFHDGRMTDESLARRLQEKMSAAHALEKVAQERNITIREPFAGSQIGIFHVLSPTRNRYIDQLIPEFQKSPELKKAAATLESFFDKAVDKTVEVLSKAADRWDMEFLPETVSTSAENESSAVLFAKTEAHGYLLTGDAGIETLRAAAEYAQAMGYDLPSQVTFVQIPHHGGRHNVSTETLDLIVGKPLAIKPEKFTRTAFVSAAKAAPTHPKRVVTNAFLRRGFNVAQTKGQSIYHFRGAERRVGWGPLTYVPFYAELDD